jgi:hypothetical protein
VTGLILVTRVTRHSVNGAVLKCINESIVVSALTPVQYAVRHSVKRSIYYNIKAYTVGSFYIAVKYVVRDLM